MPPIIQETVPSIYFGTKKADRLPKGRQKGVKNVVGRTVRWNLLEAYRQNGGLGWLAAWGKTHPSEFFPLLVKLLPAELAESGAASTIQVFVYGKQVVNPKQIVSRGQDVDSNQGEPAREAETIEP